MTEAAVIFRVRAKFGKGRAVHFRDGDYFCTDKGEAEDVRDMALYQGAISTSVAWAVMPSRWEESE